MGRKKEKLLITDLRIGDDVFVDLGYNDRRIGPMKVVGIYADGTVWLDNGSEDVFEENVKDLRWKI